MTTAGRTPDQATRTATPTRHELPIRIEIVSPAPNTTFEIDPGTRDTEPTMPLVPLEARVLVRGAPVSAGVVRWELHVSGNYRVRDRSAERGFRQQAYTHPAGNSETRPGERRETRLAPGGVTGGVLEIRASYDAGPELGGVTVTRKVTGCRVNGKPVPRAELCAYIASQSGDLAWLFLRMFHVESRHRQFAGGSPLYGDPAGVGVVQRDPEPPEWRWPEARVTSPNNFFPTIYWNWKRNVEEGIAYFHREKLRLGRADLATLRRNNPDLPAPPEEVALRAGIRRNNGGREFSASDDGAHYVAPVRAGRDYVQEVLDAPIDEADKYPVPELAKLRVWPEMPPEPAR